MTFNYIKNTSYKNNISNSYNKSSNHGNIYKIIKKSSMKYVKNINCIKNIKNLNKKTIFNYINSNFNFKKRILLLSISIICLFISNAFNSSYQIINFKSILIILFYGFILAFLSSIFIFLIKKFKIIAKKGTKEYVYISKLDEGMVIHDIIINKTLFHEHKINNKQFNRKNIENKKNKDNRKNKKKIKLSNVLNKVDFKKENEKYNLSLKKEENHYKFKIKSIAGLTSNDIYLLNELSKNELIIPFVEVKLGIPFVPSIFIGLILSIFMGDLFIFGIKIANYLI